jgi:hypothetical protein
MTNASLARHRRVPLLALLLGIAIPEVKHR